MEQQFQRKQIGEGVWFSAVRDPKFRHNSISVNIITLPEQETASENALLPAVLTRSCASCPDATRLERRLCDLYGAELSGIVVRYSECQVLSLSTVGLDDRYAQEGEAISVGCADLLCDIVLAPDLENGAFRADAFEIERRDLAETIAAEINDKRTYALRRSDALMCAGTRLAISRYGDLETLSKATPQSLYARYRALLSTARIEIMFVGCGDPAHAERRFTALFSGVGRSYADFPFAQPFPAGAAPRDFCERLDVTQSKLVMGFTTAPTDTAQHRDALRMMTLILGGTPFSRLFVNVREKRSLCYYCACMPDAVNRRVTIDSGVAPGNEAATRAAVLEELRRLAQEPPTAEELDQTKLFFANILRSTADSLSQVESWYLTGLLAGDPITPQQRIDRIAAITPEMVRESAAGLTLDAVYLLTGEEEAQHE